MEYKLIKPIIKVGNSAGVILPKNWLNGTAKIELVDKPINVQKDILEILKEELEDVAGIYLYGSYARREQRKDSDIDVLVITERKNEKIERGKYNIILISKNNLEKALAENALPIIPIIKETKPIINKELIEKYKKKAELSKKNLKNDIDRIKSALKINKKFIELKKEDSKDISDSVAYSLILNLRSIYIIDCLIKRKKINIPEFLSLIKKISGNLKVYEGYLRVKNKKKMKKTLQIKEAEKLLNYIIKKVEEQEKWTKRKERKK